MWSVRFTCLLVCRSAIFIDNKRGGKQSFPKAEGTSRWLLWMLRRSDAANDRVNRAYADEDYDRYERLIKRYCQKFGFDGDYGLFEDACTDARIFGHGIG